MKNNEQLTMASARFIYSIATLLQLPAGYLTFVQRPLCCCCASFIGSRGLSLSLCLRCPHTVGHIRLKDSRQLVGHIHRVIKACALVGLLPKRDVKRMVSGRGGAELRATCRTNLYLRLWKFMMRLRHLSVIQRSAVNATV